MKRIRVFIADDQDEVRDGFRAIVASRPDMVVVGEAGDGQSAVESVRLLRPDVLLLDIRMPRLDGIEVCRELRGVGPTRIVVVTTFGLDEYVSAALKNGACGFLLKRSRPELLIEAVLAAARGDMLVSPQLTMRLLTNPRMNPYRECHDQVVRLTPREEEIVREVALGRTNTEIGSSLFITPGTVKTHLANIQTKLGLPNRVGIASWAWSVGLVTRDNFEPADRDASP